MTTVSRWLPAGAENEARTETSPLTVIWHVPVPVHAPDQPAKVAPESGTACSWNCVPAAGVRSQVPRQSDPAPRTVPWPTTLMGSRAWRGRTFRKEEEPPPKGRQKARTMAAVIDERTGPPAFVEQAGAASCAGQREMLWPSSR